MADSKAARLSKLCDEIGFALGRGEFPENEIREFRWLWRTTPDQEKDGLSYTLKDIEEMIASMRTELSASDGTDVYRRVPITHGRPTRPPYGTYPYDGYDC